MEEEILCHKYCTIQWRRKVVNSGVKIKYMMYTACHYFCTIQLLIALLECINLFQSLMFTAWVCLIFDQHNTRKLFSLYFNNPIHSYVVFLYILLYYMHCNIYFMQHSTNNRKLYQLYSNYSYIQTCILISPHRLSNN